MADLDKVLKGLECCAFTDDCAGHTCSYWDFEGEVGCRTQMERDALELLKSQQAEIERLKSEVEKAREEGFTAGQNNVFEARNEGW